MINYNLIVISLCTGLLTMDMQDGRITSCIDILYCRYHMIVGRNADHVLWVTPDQRQELHMKIMS